MSKYLCRLCAKACSGHKNLYDEKGNPNEDYEITFKYFPAKFLEMSLSTSSAVLCLECWGHIVKFYNFQLSVIETQKRLIEAEKKLKANHEGIDHFATPSTDDDNKNVMFKEEDHDTDISLSGLEDIDIQFSSDDENPFANSHSNANDVEMTVANELKTKRQKENTSTAAIKKGSVTTTAEKQPQTLTLDQQIAQYLPSISCLLCNTSFALFELLLNHFRENHPNGKPFTKCCGKKLKNRFGIREHIRDFHIQRDILKCEVCGHDCLGIDARVEHHMQQHPEVKELHLKCPLCYNIFLTLDQFKAHYNTHFVCRYCNEAVRTYDGLKSHMLRRHPTDLKASTSFWKFRCEICEKGFKESIGYRDHVNEHTVENFYKCWVCKQKYKYWAHLKSHMQIQHKPHSSGKALKELLLSEQRYIVKYPNDRKVEKNESCLEKNSALNANNMIRVFVCDQCDLIFQMPKELKNHMQSIHSITKDTTLWPQYKCETCQQIFKEISDFQNHASSCSLKEFTDVLQVQSHVKQAHRVEKTEDISILPRHGDINKTTAKARKGNGTNQPITAGPSAATNDKLINTPNMLRVYVCFKCDITFSIPKELKSHIKSIHSITKRNVDPQYKCETCRQIFQEISHFQNHANSCFDKNFYTCPICLKKFIHVLHVKSHVKQAHKEENTEDIMRRAINTKGSCILSAHGDVATGTVKALGEIRTSEPMECDGVKAAGLSMVLKSDVKKPGV